MQTPQLWGLKPLALSLSSPGAGDSSQGLSAALPHSKTTIIKIIKKKSFKKATKPAAMRPFSPQSFSEAQEVSGGD